VRDQRALWQECRAVSGVKYLTCAAWRITLVLEIREDQEGGAEVGLHVVAEPVNPRRTAVTMIEGECWTLAVCAVGGMNVSII
jgi:hypothetical protein